MQKMHLTIQRDRSAAEWGDRLREAQRHLYAAQSCNAYGRQDVYRYLLKAERTLDELEPKGLERIRGRILLRSSWMTLLVDPDRGGRLLELSDKVAERNLLDGLPGGCVEHAFSLETQVQSRARGKAKELSDFPAGRYQARVDRVRGAVRATLSRQGWIRLDGGQRRLKIHKGIALSTKERRVVLTHRLVNGSTNHLHFLFGCELPLNLKDAHVNRTGEAPGVEQFAVVDPAARLQVSWSFSRPARLWFFPLETGTGPSRSYQGVSLTGIWPVRLRPRGSWQVRWEVSVGAPDG